MDAITVGGLGEAHATEEGLEARVVANPEITIGTSSAQRLSRDYLTDVRERATVRVVQVLAAT